MRKKQQYYKVISLICHNIQYYRQMMILSRNPYQRVFYETLLHNELQLLNYWRMYLTNTTNSTDPIDPINPINPIDPIDPIDPIGPIDPVNPINPINPISPINDTDPTTPIIPKNPSNPANEKTFTLEELGQYDGAEGRPAYVAIDGIVYDVSLEATWGGGTHFSLYAGKDLTSAFNGCHRGRPEILQNLPKVGILEG